MKKIFKIAVVACALFLLVACKSDTSHIAPPGLLVFNSPESVDMWLVYDWIDVAAFTHSLTEDELSAVFPTFDSPSAARALYRRDGFLIGVEGQVADSRVQIAAGGSSLPTDMFQFGDTFAPHVSDVYGTPVTAIMIAPVRDDWIAIQWMNFRAEFMLGDIAYRIHFQDYKDVGQVRMTELVTQLILGGAEGLAVLENPVIPELRSDELTFDEALLDPDFGSYAPSNTPDRFTPSFALRYISQYGNALHLMFDADDYGHIIWRISTVADEPQPRLPARQIFQAEDFTLDVLQANANWIDLGKLEIPPYWTYMFQVQFNDIFIYVSAIDVLPEELWAMFADLIQ